MPRGVDFKVPLRDVQEAHRAHLAGWSIRALARLHWRQWGYASPASAAMGLSAAMRALDLPVRDRVEATRLARTVHGELTRDAADPGHPDHALHLERRRWNRAQKRLRDQEQAVDRFVEDMRADGRMRSVNTEQSYRFRRIAAGDATLALIAVQDADELLADLEALAA